MGRIERFEDLLAWQKARVLNRSIYQATAQPSFARDFALVNQIRRASISVMSNIAEGFERYGDNEFHQFLSIAKASCAEVRCQLYVALDAGHVDETTFNELMSQAHETGRLIGGLRTSVQNRKSKS
jgi:four helix bundle protein